MNTEDIDYCIEKIKKIIKLKEEYFDLTDNYETMHDIDSWKDTLETIRSFKNGDLKSSLDSHMKFLEKQVEEARE